MKKNAKTAIVLVALFFVGYCNAQQNIFINQLGYPAQSLKVAYTDFAADSFAVIHTGTNEIVFKGGFEKPQSRDKNSGFHLYKGDFSALSLPGDYVIRLFSNLNSGINSYPFTIGDSVYNDLLRKASRSLFLQRCGMGLDQQYAGKHAHGPCHLNDAEYHPSCNMQGRHDVTGGWHDAGDFGKYIAAGAVTAAYLYRAFELQPNKHQSDQTNIPESGNGIPDLLDEVRYEIDWMLRMQRTDGAVHEKVHTKQYEAFSLPDKALSPRFIYQVSSTATADFAAIMAYSYRIYLHYDSQFAQHCLQAALRAYDYLDNHPSVFPEGGFVNPPDTNAGGYSDANDVDERLWAAIELYASTLEEKYLRDFERLFKEVNDGFGVGSWSNPATLGYYTLLKVSETKTTKHWIQLLKGQLFDYCDNLLAVAQKDGFGVAMKSEDFIWGSNSFLLKKAINLIYAYEISGNSAYLDLTQSHLNYILGVNPTKYCYVTGVGTKQILHLHHAPSIGDVHPWPIEGILTGGPNRFLNDAALKRVFNESTPPALTFIDDIESYASNENTISGHSVLYFVAAYLNQP